VPLLDASVNWFGQAGVLSLIPLRQSGLPGLFGSITASALLICRLMRSTVSSLASSLLGIAYAGVGYVSISSSVW